MFAFAQGKLDDKEDLIAVAFLQTWKLRGERFLRFLGNLDPLANIVSVGEECPEWEKVFGVVINGHQVNWDRGGRPCKWAVGDNEVHLEHNPNIRTRDEGRILAREVPSLALRRRVELDDLVELFCLNVANFYIDFEKLVFETLLKDLWLFFFFKDWDELFERGDFDIREFL